MHTTIDLEAWELRWKHLAQAAGGDGAHDVQHVARVVGNARRLALECGAALAVVIPAAWLHDCVWIPKQDPRRSLASRLAGEAAQAHLQADGYPREYHSAIYHAICAHSWSSGIAPQTLEAQVVQDADRLDALGAIGLARCLISGATMQRPLYHPQDPFCDARPSDDGAWSLDHLPCKLYRLPGSMQTAAGRKEAERRVAFLRAFQDQLASEIL